MDAVIDIRQAKNERYDHSDRPVIELKGVTKSTASACRDEGLRGVDLSIASENFWPSWPQRLAKVRA
jgi:hypothetical protein